MVLENHAKKRVMHEDPNNIRGEDIRIDYDENIKKLKNKLCAEYKLQTGIPHTSFQHNFVDLNAQGKGTLRNGRERKKFPFV